MFKQNGVSGIISAVRGKFNRIKLFRSLGVRIFLIICIVGIVPAAILRNILLNSYETRAISVRKGEIQNQCMILADHLVTYGYLTDQSSEVVNAELEQFSSLYNGRIMIIDGNLKIIKDTYSISQGKIMISEEILRCFDKDTISKHDKINQYIEFTTPITDHETGTVLGVILTSISTESIAKTIEIMSRQAYIFEIIISVIIISFSFFVSISLIKPFRDINTAIIQVEEGFTEEKISVPVYNETESIAASFNKLTEKMNTLESSRQEFVSNVSHELKTPITSVKVLADSLLSQDNVPVEIYREFMEDITNEIDREDKIINDLLSLVKLDKQAGSLMNISVVDINSMIEDIIKRVRPIADRAKVELILESIRPVSAEIDEIKLSLAIMNVIENGIKYNKENGWVKVSVDADAQFFTVIISDCGIGIPQDSLAHIYERFYRVDKSHSREIGGTGLGLAITRNTVLMHDGAIKVESSEGVGTTFTIKIPKNHVTVVPKPDTVSGKSKKPRVSKAIKNVMMVFLISGLIFGLSGCAHNKENSVAASENVYSIYYPVKENRGVKPVKKELLSQNSDEIINELLDLMSDQPGDYELKPTIPEDVPVYSVSLNEGLLVLDFGSEYYKITGREEILRRAAIVRTLDQCSEIKEISFTVEGSPLNDSGGNPVGMMTADMFIDNAGDEINSYERIKLVLYYANEEGDRLIKTTEAIAYNSNISMEKIVSERVLSGPLSYGVFPVTNPEVKLLSVSTKDGVCYVNLSKEFLTKKGKLSDEVVLYSFVNSLTELPNVNKVQFMIDSETEISFGDHTYLDEP
ncbi:MAG: GerMN domain-containing protein, partial [Lachnospiraceae bacterium]|nr:GerMN domain-containing protein [Lachnospiraceae bacterium]